jgi:biopolymer transport protein ExbD
MTPMIDVVFLLLIYFVWIASFNLPEFALPANVTTMQGSSNVPITDPLPDTDFEEIVVRIVTENDQTLWRVNDEPAASLKAVRGQLEIYVSITPDVPVIVHPDGDIEAGDAIDAYDLARLVGFKKVALATPIP